jgi:hypothetical protein
MSPTVPGAALLVGLLSSDDPLAKIRTEALSGQHSPGLAPTSTFTSFSTPVLNDRGQVAFIATTPTASGVWSEAPGFLAIVARDDVPGALKDNGTLLRFSSTPNPRQSARI